MVSSKTNNKHNTAELRHTMRKDSQLSLAFKGISGKRVMADFRGGEITSDAGVLVLSEIADRLDSIDQFADAIPDKRHQNRRRT